MLWLIQRKLCCYAAVIHRYAVMQHCRKRNAQAKGSKGQVKCISSEWGMMYVIETQLR